MRSEITPIIVHVSQWWPLLKSVAALPEIERISCIISDVINKQRPLYIVGTPTK